jgi:hypothetical protein
MTRILLFVTTYLGLLYNYKEELLCCEIGKLPWFVIFYGTFFGLRPQEINLDKLQETEVILGVVCHHILFIAANSSCTLQTCSEG